MSETYHETYRHPRGYRLNNNAWLSQLHTSSTAAVPVVAVVNPATVVAVAVATDKVVPSAQQVRVVAPAETTMSALPAHRVQAVVVAAPARRTQQISLVVPAGVDMFN